MLNLNLKDYTFIHELDRPRVSFSLLVFNNGNNLNDIDSVHKAFPHGYLIHYMDDILLSSASVDMLLQVYAMGQQNQHGLVIVPEKLLKKK